MAISMLQEQLVLDTLTVWQRWCWGQALCSRLCCRCWEAFLPATSMWILECMCFSQGLGSYPSVTSPTSGTWWRATLCTATGTEIWYWVETLWTQILRGFWILQVWEYGRNNIRIPTLVETWENRKRRQTWSLSGIHPGVRCACILCDPAVHGTAVCQEMAWDTEQSLPNSMARRSLNTRDHGH